MMALRVVSEVFGLAWRHPFVSFGILLLFTPPFFPIIRFFSPLLISTAVFIIAMVSLGPSSKHGVSESEDWDLRKSPDVRVWEDKVIQEQENGERPSKKRKSGKESWVDWVKNVEAIGLAWVDQKLKSEENWPGQTLDDHNVSILQEAFGRGNLTSPDGEIAESYAEGKERESKPSVSREAVSMELPIYDEAATQNRNERTHVYSFVRSHPDETLGEDAEEVAEEGEAGGKGTVSRAVNSPLMHDLSSVPVIQIPPKFALAGETLVESPSAGVDDAVDLIKPRPKVVGSVARNSDFDSPPTLASASVKLSGMESLADAIESHENDPVHGSNNAQAAAATAGPEVLHHSTSEKVNDIIEKLKVFCEDGIVPPPSKQSSPLFKPLPTQQQDNNKKPKKKKLLDSSDDEDTSSGEEVLSDSDSDSGFQIFPAHPTAEIKVHPPMKLDKQHLEQLQEKASNSGAQNATYSL